MVQGNRIAVEVKELLPRSPDVRAKAVRPSSTGRVWFTKRQDTGNPALVRPGPICYIARHLDAGRSAGVHSNAVVAELVDALA